MQLNQGESLVIQTNTNLKQFSALGFCDRLSKVELIFCFGILVFQPELILIWKMG